MTIDDKVKGELHNWIMGTWYAGFLIQYNMAENYSERMKALRDYNPNLVTSELFEKGYDYNTAFELTEPYKERWFKKFIQTYDP